MMMLLNLKVLLLKVFKETKLQQKIGSYKSIKIEQLVILQPQ